MKLSELAHITSGINEKRNPQGGIFYLGASDFVEESQLDYLIQPSVVYSSKLDKHFLKEKDVLVLSKGHNGFNAFIYNDKAKKTVASTIFMVLRNLKHSIIPGYLTWYINLKSTQDYLINYGRGSTLPAINKQILGDLNIPVPPLEMQNKIVKLNNWKKKESKLIKEIDKQKSKALELKLKEII